jgi:hypothetical protein
MKRLALVLTALSFGACVGERPQGLAPTPQGPGPLVKWDIDAKPLPEIPLPNDIATRADPTSATGRRVNVSEEAPTAYERGIRRWANQMEGFGTYAPLSVRFTAPLDLDNIFRRHRRNKDFADDAVFLLNLQPGSGNFGKPVPLDFGHGNFPLTVAEPDRYWENDPRRNVQNLLFDTTDEDQNHNGVVDPGEDTDDDGWLDVPNVYPAGADPVDGLLSFYEKVTNTLIFRPILPLEQESRYAVVLTKRLLGTDGNPIRSPFPFVNHTRQTESLRELPTALARNGLSLADVAFTWVFTTQGPTRDLEALRRGLYGNGVFARLAKEFPPDAEVKPIVSEGTRLHLLSGAKLLSMADIVIPYLFGGNEDGIRMLKESIYNVDYVVHGEVEGPNLLADKDGIASPGYPADNDEVWDLNRVTGHAFYRPQKVRFWCTIPRKDRGRGPPFPVAFYMHGHTSSRFDMLGFAGFMARYGIAHCGINAYGHGLVIPPDFQEIARGLMDALGVRPLIEAMVPDRARDLDNDGVPDSGVDFWTADLFHLRDMVRQSVLDQMLVIRAFRAFDGTRRAQQDLFGTGQPPLAGDFDGDGVVDIGGPLNDYFVWGHSLGGILSSVVAGIEPAITAAAPVCFAAGLAEVGLRTARFGVPDSVILPILGPIFVGEPAGSGQVKISQIVQTLTRRVKEEIATTAVIEPGDRLVIENLVNLETYQAYADSQRRFRLHIPADALDAPTKRWLLKLPVTPAGQKPPSPPDTRMLGDALRILVYDGRTNVLKKEFNKFEREVAFQGVTYPIGAPLVALNKGLGMQRNTPNFRRLLGAFAQVFVEPADPVNYAPHYFLDPLPSSDYDPAEPGANVLLMPTLGDPGVSVGCGIAGARAAGLIDIFTPDPRYGKSANDVLIDNYIVEGLARMRRFDGREILMDPENFSQGRWVPDAPRLDPPLRLTKATGSGLQALRLPMLDPRGQHCFDIPNPRAQFDNNTFLIHLITRYFQSRGREIRDNDLCMEDQTCSWMPPNAPESAVQ